MRIRDWRSCVCSSDLRWTPETASKSLYPRLSVGTNVNNHVRSDFWLRPASYLRLKNAEISYTFDDIALGKLKVGGLRIFLNGLNLLTVSDFSQSDPEVRSEEHTYELQSLMRTSYAVFCLQKNNIYQNSMIRT